MKKILTTLIAISCVLQAANSQSDDFAQLNNKTLHLKNGIVLNEGDVLHIGNPTGCYENCFENIFYEPEEMVSKITYKFTKNIYANYSGEKVSIKKIRQISKKNEKIWLIILYYRPKKENLYCYLEKALNTGELLIKTDNIVTYRQVIEPEAEQTEILKAQENAEKNTVNFSIADEIRKLKALLDEGIITREEFEKQKAKLLE
ncbi:MAG: SHOCT domain-containing protein [Prevotellaceae bacterium]|jgi:hypothetical protein|nr:SHOCT domain-containing protein [Prevotellaceae bacterium]